MGNYPDNKCTADTKKERIEMAAEWIIKNPDKGFVKFCDWASASFNVKTRQAAKYRVWAMEALGDKQYNENIEGARRAAIASLQTMLDEASEVKEKLAIRQEINKISGLYTQKIELDQKADVPLFQVNIDS